MLKGIPAILSPDLMKVMMEMGHGDEIVIADANFPAVACAQRLVRCDGHAAADILGAMLRFLPLDYAVDKPAAVMALLPGEPMPPAWETYRQIIVSHEPRFSDFEYVERFEFYERTKRAFAVVATGDQGFKANLLLKKGVYRDK